MRHDRLLLEDILASIDEIAGTLPASRDAFLVDKFVQSHVYRHVMIIGEACWRLDGATKALRPEVPWRRIASMRHVLVHDYFRVNWSLVFDTAATAVPELRPHIVELLVRVPPLS